MTGPSVSNQEKAAARSFTPPQGKALLYVYRASSIPTMMMPSYCWVNHTFVGKNGAGTCMAIPLSPGKYIVHAIRDPRLEQPTPPIAFTASAGKLYFIRQKISPTTEGMVILPTGVVPGFRCEAVEVSDSTGHEDVSKCRQIGAAAIF